MNKLQLCLALLVAPFCVLDSGHSLQQHLVYDPIEVAGQVAAGVLPCGAGFVQLQPLNSCLFNNCNNENFGKS